MTVFLSLLMLMFLTFCLVLAEGVRMYLFRAKAEQAAELTGFSVLSEYHPQLLADYGLFFLDLDYGLPKEQTAVLHARAGQYLAENSDGISTQQLNVRNFVRATDGGGSAFFEQAAETVRLGSGIGEMQELLAEVTLLEDGEGLSRKISDEETAAEGILSEFTDEEGEPLFDIELPQISFPDIGVLTNAVFGEDAVLSEKSFSSAERIGSRNCAKGAGRESEKDFWEMQRFHAYLLDRCAYYGSSGRARKEALEYQAEYVIAGEDNDRDNLVNIMWRIFLLRAGGNYTVFHQDAAKMAEADAKAAALVGITGNAALVGIVRELFLLAEAVDEGVSDTREIFHGGKLPLIGNGEFLGMKAGYREYLLLFLQTTAAEDKIIRCMNVIEMEMRRIPGGENFRFDHCTDCFEMEWTYRFPGLFMDLPFLDGAVYQNRIRRKIYYEV